MAKKQLTIAKTDKRMELLEELRVKLGQSTYAKTIDIALMIAEQHLRRRNKRKHKLDKERPPLKHFKEKRRNW